MHRFSVLLLVLLLTFGASAQYGPASQQPGVKLRGRNNIDLLAAQKVLVSNYCRLDFEGARLQTSGWARFKQVTTLRDNPEFSGIVVVSRFDIDTPEDPTDSLSATYQQIGFYTPSEGYKRLAGTDRVTFRMQEQNGNIFISSVGSEAPHVSLRAAIAWMNARLADPNTSEPERIHLKEAVAQLTKLLPQSRAATSTPGA